MRLIFVLFCTFDQWPFLPEFHCFCTADANVNVKFYNGYGQPVKKCICACRMQHAKKLPWLHVVAIVLSQRCFALFYMQNRLKKNAKGSEVHHQSHTFSHCEPPLTPLRAPARRRRAQQVLVPISVVHSRWSLVCACVSLCAGQVSVLPYEYGSFGEFCALNFYSF